MVVMLSIHYTRFSDIIRPDHLRLEPSLPVKAYRDGFGNWCHRLVAPQGRLKLSADAVVRDSGRADPVMPWIQQCPVQSLPEETLLFLRGSRRSPWRVPRLRASGGDPMPLPQHTGSLLYGILRRHRPPAALSADGFCRLVRGFFGG